MKNEKWVTCLEFPNYEVSDTGKIRRAKNSRELIIATDTRGYSVVRIWYNAKKYTKRVARLVWTSFNECNCAETVDHIDRNKDNNFLTNLRCISHRDNSLNRNKMGKNVYNLTDDKKSEIINKLKNGESTVRKIWNEYGIPTNYMNIVLQRGSWDKYLNDTKRVQQI